MSYIRCMKQCGHGALIEPFIKYGFTGGFVEKTDTKHFINERKEINPIFFANIIDRSFYWDETPNGHKFWGDIYDYMQEDMPYIKEKISYEEFSRIKRG